MALFDSSTPDPFDPLAKYQGVAATTGDSLSLPTTIVGGAVAAVTDIGTTFWNSLTPKKYEVSTADLLSRINTDALQVYNEHPDAVHAASFIGGLVAPVGVAMKGMGLLRAGAKGASWFSEAGKASNLLKVEEAFKEAGAVNAAFNKAKFDIYRNVALNNILDSAVAEFAIIGTMSAHPYMEDYSKDFTKNFAIGVAFGGVVGTGIGSIIAKGDITKLVAPIEAQGNKLILDKLIKPRIEAEMSKISHIGEQVAVRAHAVDEFKALLADIESGVSDLVLAPYTMTKLKSVIQSESAKIYQLLEDSSTGALKDFIAKAPEETKQYLLDFASRVENAGLDKIAFAEVAETSKQAGKGSGLLSTVANYIKDVTKKDGTIVQQNADAYYSSIFDRYFGVKDGYNYMTMADLGTSVKALEAEAKNISWRFPRPDIAFELEISHSAKVDAEYAKAILTLSNVEAKDFKHLVVNPNDLPMMKAVYLRAKELGLDDLNVRVTTAKPSWDIQQKAILKRSGLDPEYGTKLRAMENMWDRFTLYHHGAGRLGKVSSEAENMLADWVAGSYTNMRNAAGVLRRTISDPQGTFRPDYYKQVMKVKAAIEEIQNSSQSQALRAELAKLADEDGNVWLYRGMRNAPTGHKSVESYSILAEKAAEFGEVKLYKVHVDDIIGTVKDFGPTGKRPEILAFPPTREHYDIARTNLKKIPDEIVLKESGEILTAKPTVDIVGNLSDFEAQLQASLVSKIKDLSQQGYGVEAIAIRTGLPIDQNLESIISTALSSGYVPPAGLFKYTSTADIELALATEKRTLAMTTAPAKNLSADVFANLNKMDLDKTSAGLVEMNLLTSSSAFVRELGERFASVDYKTMSKFLVNDLEEYTNIQLKSSLFGSSNQVLSEFPALAAIATVMGKEAIALRNSVKEAFEKPLSNAMSVVMKDPAALIEFNTAINLNASLSGWRIFKDGKFWQKGKDAAGKEILEEAQFRGRPFTVLSPSVITAMEEMQKYGAEMYTMKDIYRKSIGQSGLSDIGFWVPAVNVSNKEIAYVHDLVADKTTMLFAKTPEELNEGVAAFEKSMKAQGKQIRVVLKSDQEAFNKLAGRHDPMFMEIADLSKRHGGSSAATFVPTDASSMQEILGGYGHYVDRAIDDLITTQISPILDHLRFISETSQAGYSAEKGNIIQKLTNKPTDGGMVLANILMGKPNLYQHKWWSELQQRGQVATDFLLQGVSDAFSPFLSKTVRTPEMWKEIQADMEKRGIFNPFEGLDKEFGMGRYLAEGMPSSEAMTPRAISLFNGAAATVLLRFMELGQPLVNALSLPILTSGAVNRKMASSFMGEALDPNAKFTLAKTMYDGIRMMNHPIEGAKWSKLGEAKNLFSAELRNVTELMENMRSLEPGLMRSSEDLLESSFVKLLSKPSDYSEGMVRKISFFNGVTIAKQAYPGLSDLGVVTFARNFMDEAVGNYTAQQRPAMFQGTFGVAFGLFQTYMLTLSQQIYRGVQNRDWANLGKQMLTQASIFGGASLPGFHLVSEQIGKHFSDQHIDLETGTFRAIPDPVANTILYGLPSSLGPGITTRGDIQPRLPNPFQGINSVAAANIVGQSFTAMERVASAAFSADENAGKAMLEALSLQSISRPVARMSELLTGTALTGAGNVVASGSEIYNTQGVISRIFATRPLSEIKAREAMQLNSLYGGADSDRRKAVAKRLKSHIRSGRLDTETLDELAYEYLRTGTPTGWRSAVSEALIQESGDGSDTVKRKLHPGSPLNRMIEDTD